MSVTFGPPIVLAGPLPQPLPFGLLAAADVIEEPSARWGNGANIRGYPEGPAQVWDPCSVGTFRDKDTGDQPDAEFFAAFVVYLADQCAARGVGTDAALEGRA